MLNTESVLLIHDDERELVELHSILEKRVRTDDQLKVTRSDGFERAAPRSNGLRPGDEPDGNAERTKPRVEIFLVLLGEQFGGCHQRDLTTTADRARCRCRCDHCFSTADVALHQTNHRLCSLQITFDVIQTALLRSRQGIRQRFFEASRQANGVVQGCRRIRASRVA